MRKSIERFKWGLQEMEDSAAEGDLDCRGPGLRGFMGGFRMFLWYFGEEQGYFLPLSEVFAWGQSGEI